MEGQLLYDGTSVDLQTPMTMDEVQVTVTNSLDVSHVVFLGFVGELAPEFMSHDVHCMPLQSFPSLL